MDSFDSSKTNSGYVQAFIDGQWGYICALGSDPYWYEFGIAEANVVCRQLGYDEVNRGRNYWDTYDDNSTESNYTIAQAHCYGNEDNLGQCFIDTNFPSTTLPTWQTVPPWQYDDNRYCNGYIASVTCNTVTTGKVLDGSSACFY